MRSIICVGTSKDDISALPDPVKASFGYPLRQVQQRKTPLDTRALRQKSTSGIAIPRPDVELIEMRLRRAHSLDAED